MASCVSVTVTSSPTPQPNLNVTSLSGSATTIQAGQAVSLNAVVVNSGNAASGAWRVVFVVTPPGGSPVSSNSATQAALAAGGTANVNTTVTLSIVGANQVCANIAAA